jgi:hypothetical protein
MKAIHLFAFLITVSSSVAQPVLTDVSTVAGVVHRTEMSSFQMPAQGGAAWFDHDNDGWFDLYLTGGSAPDAFFVNNGDGTFTDATASAGFSTISALQTNGVVAADFNRDGLDDVFITTFKTAANQLFMNNGDGTFTHMTEWAGSDRMSNSFSAVAGDLNLDGWPDIYVCNWSLNMQVIINGPIVSIDSEENLYYENNGDGTFTEKAIDLGIDDPLGCGLGVMFTDFDNDSDPDVFVANDFGYTNGNTENRMFRNEYPLPMFTEVSQSLGLNTEMNGMGVAKGDPDLDGDLDLYITNIKKDKYMVNNLGFYEDQLVQSGLKNDSVWLLDFSMKRGKTGWGVGFLDIDNDMDEDLFTVNGDLYYDYPNPTLDSNKLFLNDGTGQFENVSLSTGIADTYVSRALAYCDYDNDGDLDVFVGVTDSIGGNAQSILYRNDTPSQHWLQVRAFGDANNPNGIGTKVRIYTNGQMQLREIGGESSFNCQHWLVAHFGLGANSVVDSVQVEWYGGVVQRFYDVSADQRMEVYEPEQIVTSMHDAEEGSGLYPNPFSNEVIVRVGDVRTIEIFTVEGALIKSVMGVGAVRSVDTSGLPAGSYLFRLTTQNGVVSETVCVKH